MILQMKKKYVHDGAPGVNGLTEVVFNHPHPSLRRFISRAEKRRRRNHEAEVVQAHCFRAPAPDCRPFNLS